MPTPDPSAWSLWIWLLHAGGLVYVVGFVWEFFRLRRLEQRADAGDREAQAAYERATLRFPHSFYAKMLGHAPRAVREAEERTGPQVGRGR